MSETKALELDVKLKGAQSLTDFKNVMKEARDAAIGMKEGSAEYQKFIKIAAAAKDEIGDMNERINALDPGSKAAAFKALGQTMIGGFQAATGALAVFTGDNEELNQILLKSIAITNALSGIQAIADAKKQAGNIAIILGLNAQAAATGRLTIAQRVLNAVASVNPYVWVVTAAAAVATLSFELGKWFAQSQQQKEIEAGWKSLTETLTAQIPIQEEMIRQAGLEGKSLEEVNRLTKELIESKKDLLFIEQQEILAKLRSGEITDEDRKRYKEIKAEQFKLKGDELQADKELADGKEKEADKEKKRLDVIRDAHQKYLDGVNSDRIKAQEEGNKRREENEEAEKRGAEDLKNSLIKTWEELQDAQKDKDTKSFETLKEEAHKKFELQSKEDQRLIDANDEKNKALVESDKLAQQAKLSALNSGINLISTLSEGFIQDAKARAIIQLAVDEAKAIGSAVAGAAEAAAATGPAAPFTIIAFIASSLAAIATPIIAAKKALGKGGSSPSTGGGSTPSIPQPRNVNPVNERTLLDDAESRRTFKTYVVSSDMTKSQQTEALLKIRAQR